MLSDPENFCPKSNASLKSLPNKTFPQDSNEQSSLVKEDILLKYIGKKVEEKLNAEKKRRQSGEVEESVVATAKRLKKCDKQQRREAERREAEMRREAKAKLDAEKKAAREAALAKRELEKRERAEARNESLKRAKEEKERRQRETKAKREMAKRCSSVSKLLSKDANDINLEILNRQLVEGPSSSSAATAAAAADTVNSLTRFLYYQTSSSFESEKFIGGSEFVPAEVRSVTLKEKKKIFSVNWVNPLSGTIVVSCSQTRCGNSIQIFARQFLESDWKVSSGQFSILLYFLVRKLESDGLSGGVLIFVHGGIAERLLNDRSALMLLIRRKAFVKFQNKFYR